MPSCQRRQYRSEIKRETVYGSDTPVALEATRRYPRLVGGAPGSAASIWTKPGSVLPIPGHRNVRNKAVVLPTPDEFAGSNIAHVG